MGAAGMRSLRGTYRFALIAAVLVVSGITVIARHSFHRWRESEVAASLSSDIVKLAGELTWLATENEITDRTVTQWNRTVKAIGKNLHHLSGEASGNCPDAGLCPGQDAEEISRLLLWGDEVFHLMRVAPSDRARRQYANSLATVVVNLASSARLLNLLYGVELRRAAVWEIILVLALSNLILLVVVTAAGFVLHRRVLTPLWGLQEAITAYGADGTDGTESVQVKLTGATEIDTLIRSYNDTVQVVAQHLRDQEVLIRETHHRIKNNIASIGSLLSLQASTIDNPEAVAALEEAIGRVHSIGNLYERMLVGDEYQEMDAAPYLGDLADSVVSLSVSRARIVLEKQLESVVLPQKQLVSLGIVTNELLTNACKYAFRGRDEGHVSLRLYREGMAVVLSVEDDGGGVHEPPKPQRGTEGRTGFGAGSASGGFGLQLVEMVCTQIGGTFKVGSDASGGGTRAAVTFQPVGG
ncbi:MAG: sensor histidine kinase [Spirochaetaceae bacterium]|nr:MAG: sensor histidine kinase [Spirochaetaceae bacterium]